MKILLINPPRSPHNSILEYAPDEARPFIHKKLIGPPLGLLTVAAALRNFDVALFDMKGEYDLNPSTPDVAELTRQLLERYQPDVVGVTVITSEFPAAMEILATVKSFDADIITVAGGLHTTLCPYDFAGQPADVVCPGQSAYVFRRMLESLSRGGRPADTKGIWLNTPAGYVSTGADDTPANMAGDAYLMPDRRLLEPWRQTYRVGNAPGPTTYLFTSLGCPYKCTFCSIWCEFGGGYSMRSVDSIVAELKSIDYNIVRFADANTVVDVEHISHLFDRIEAEGIHKEYIMDIRADITVKHPWLIEKMARNGLKVVICGFESYREAELQKYNKASSAAYIHKAIDIFHQNGVMLRGNYVIPNDYTLDDFRAMADYAASHRVTYAGYTILTPMPGTVYYSEVKGQITEHRYDRYNFFNCVLPTTLPLDEFNNEVGKLWLIKKGVDVI